MIFIEIVEVIFHLFNRTLKALSFNLIFIIKDLISTCFWLILVQLTHVSW